MTIHKLQDQPNVKKPKDDEKECKCHHRKCPVTSSAHQVVMTVLKNVFFYLLCGFDLITKAKHGH